MKMSDEHYKLVEDACTSVLHFAHDAKQRYKDDGLSDKRFRWDVLHASTINGKKSMYFITDELYPYLNDTHIDTALRKMFGHAA